MREVEEGKRLKEVGEIFSFRELDDPYAGIIQIRLNGFSLSLSWHPVSYGKTIPLSQRVVKGLKKGGHFKITKATEGKKKSLKPSSRISGINEVKHHCLKEDYSLQAN